jgi:uncharacterized secreted protein with C-terminal beta-propeller domain
MDQHGGFFRIATTTGDFWSNTSNNNVFVLDENLSIVAAIENIAPGERIYAARFIGERAYLVTFKDTDPFFAIDLADPYHPRILGNLTIPGYSDYLHPYDENHIIGIGKDTVESDRPDFAWYQGVKIALFNVTNVSDDAPPVEMAKVVIGDRGTDSPLLRDHKALLFDREKNLFVIPVSVYEIDDSIKEEYGNDTAPVYGTFTFQGAYVYNLTLENGFVLRGTITHMDNATGTDGGRWYYGYGDRGTSISRCLYIGDSLYTVSESMVKAHHLETLQELARIPLS